MRRDPADIPAADWAAALLAVDPGLGGICLRARAWPGREAWVAAALALTGGGSRRMPVGASEDRIFGGLDLAATLTAGRPVVARGLLAEAGSGTIVLPMAERLERAVAARLCQAWDEGAGFGLIALDESDAPDTAPPRSLMDRLAFWCALDPEPIRDSLAPMVDFEAQDIEDARTRLAGIVVPDRVLGGLTSTAAALGIGSLRAPLLALRTARALAALEGAAEVTQPLAELAAALVLAPRATRLPDQPPVEEDTDEAPPPPPAPEKDTDPPDQSDPPSDERSEELLPPEDRILDAARAAIPADLLAQLAARGALTRQSGQGGGAGADKKGLTRGRPAGTRRGDPRSGARLDLVGTLRAAAPWQPLRRKMASTSDPARVLVTPDDFRIKQFKERTEKVVIFVVDASGSAAMTRLAETKGAIELMLAEAYVRREQVAMIAFRGTGADLLLPPTRSLVQAKKRLSALPGGGGTPLAAGIDAAAVLADQLRRRGQSPHIALLTDGQANIARDGTPGRPQASEDAGTAARMLRSTGVPVVVIDTGPRPRPQGRALAADLGALYLPMPRADAHQLGAALRSALTEPSAA